MKSSEFITEIRLDTSLDKNSLASDREMQTAYKFADGMKAKRYDLPELPDHTVEVFEHNSNTILIVLVNDDTQKAEASIELERSSKPKFGKFYAAVSTKVKRSLQGRGIAPILYKFIITDLKIPLMSDTVQSIGSAKLWSKIAQDPQIQVKAVIGKNTYDVEYDSAKGRLKVRGKQLYLTDSPRWWESKSTLIATPRKGQAQVNEIKWNPETTRTTGVYTKRDMNTNYRSLKNDRVYRHEIPELPDHTFEYTHDNDEIYGFLVNDDTEEVTATIVLVPTKDLIKGKRFYEVTGIKVLPELQGKGIGPNLYKFMIKDIGINIAAGISHTPGSAKLWTKLFNDPGINVIAYDLKEKITLPIEIDQTMNRLKTINGPSLYHSRNKTTLLATRK